jgi:hypothetical protein
MKILRSTGDNASSRGAKLFPNNPKLGEKYYFEIMKTIILFAESCPKDPFTGEETQLKKALTDLSKSGYELPAVAEIGDIREEYESGL